MPLKIVRNDITKMQVDAIVNTANTEPIYSYGVDTAVYKAAGEEELLAIRREIGCLDEGEVAITPGFKLPAKYIIHAVSPFYIDGESGEEELLRSCYRKSLRLAYENGCKSIAFPLISTGSFCYPKEEGMRIALDEINAFLLKHEILVYIVVFDETATKLGKNLYPALEAYIDSHYVAEKKEEEYGDAYAGREEDFADEVIGHRLSAPLIERSARPIISAQMSCDEDFYFFEKNESALQERIEHMTDTFQEYLLYLIEQKGLTNAQVYTNAYITKQTFSKIKNNKDYHPEKATALQLCIGAKLNIDETTDLLARAGYALSTSDMRDVIIRFFIENEMYEMTEIEIALDEYGAESFV